MRKMLILMPLLITTIVACTPPYQLAAEREKHAAEMRALESSKRRVEESLDHAEDDLASCKSDLEYERARRNDDSKGVAFFHWCNVIGSAYGVCDDPLYIDGRDAHEAGESASFRWLFLYFASTVFVLSLAGLILILVPGVLWMRVRYRGALTILDQIHKD